MLIKVDKTSLSSAYKHIEKQIGFKTFYTKNKSEKIEIEIDPISIL